MGCKLSKNVSVHRYRPRIKVVEGQICVDNKQGQTNSIQSSALSTRKNEYTQEYIDNCNNEEVSVISSTSLSRVEEYPRVSFMIRLLSVKIIDVTFSLSQTIDDVRIEIQSQFGLVPSQYILKAGISHWLTTDAHS